MLYSMLILIPIGLATQRLILVTGPNPYDWTKSLSENYISQNVLEFTLVQAVSSTLLTIIISLPIAWYLGRHRWPFESLIRTVLTLPFVIPSIIAAMGILTIVGPYGLDIRTNENTWWWTLIISHAWFNMALIIRFCEPLLSKLDLLGRAVALVASWQNKSFKTQESLGPFVVALCSGGGVHDLRLLLHLVRFGPMDNSEGQYP